MDRLDVSYTAKELEPNKVHFGKLIAVWNRDKTYDLAIALTVVFLREMHVYAPKRCLQECLLLSVIAQIRNIKNVYLQSSGLIYGDKFMLWKTTPYDNENK